MDNLPTLDDLPILTDLKIVRRRAHRNKHENHVFARWIADRGNQAQPGAAETARAAAEDVWGCVECTSCANCCRTLQITVENEDVERLARRLDLPVEEFQRRFVRQDRAGDLLLPSAPCMFLEGNRCSVYEDRPRVCRQYPYLYDAEFTTRLPAAIERSFTCPIVFNALELLKRRLGFPTRRRS